MTGETGTALFCLPGCGRGGTVYCAAWRTLGCGNVALPEACRMKDDNSTESIVFIVDDDPLVRESLSSLLRSVGLQT